MIRNDIRVSECSSVLFCPVCWELLVFCSFFKKVGKDVNIFVQNQKVLNWILFLCFFLGNGILGAKHFLRVSYLCSCQHSQWASFKNEGLSGDTVWKRQVQMNLKGLARSVGEWSNWGLGRRLEPQFFRTVRAVVRNLHFYGGGWRKWTSLLPEMGVVLRLSVLQVRVAPG